MPPVFPTPTGQAPLSTQLTQADFDVQLQQALAYMRSQGHNQLAAEFQAFAQKFHAEHPNLTVTQVADAFLATDLGKALSAGIGGTGAMLGQVPGAAAKGAEKAVQSFSNPLDAIAQFLAFPEKILAWISNRGNWVRIAKVGVGGTMILVGLNMLVTKESSVVNAAETVAKVVK